MQIILMKGNEERDCKFTRSDRIKYHKLGGLNFGNSVSQSLQTRSSKSRCLQCCFLLRYARKNLPQSFSWLLVVCWQSLAFLGFCSVTPVSASSFMWPSSYVHAYVHIFPLCKDIIPVGLGVHPYWV